MVRFVKFMLKLQSLIKQFLKYECTLGSTLVVLLPYLTKNEIKFVELFAIMIIKLIVFEFQL